MSSPNSFPQPRFSFDRTTLLVGSLALLSILILAMNLDPIPDAPGGEGGGVDEDPNRPHPDCPACGVHHGSEHAYWCPFGFV